MTQDNISRTGSRMSSYICPALLGGSICFAVIYALYRPMCVFYTVLFLIAELLLFRLFDRLQKMKTLGGLLYMALMILVYMASFRLMIAGFVNYDLSIITWFYGEEGSFYSQPLYLNAVFLGGGYFVISILYYFTQVRYRSLGVMLSILFPFVIYAKRAEEIPEVMVTVIITLYIAVMVHNRRIDPAMPAEKRGSLKINRSYLISMAVFVSVTGAITMMIEKPTYQSQLEKNSNYFDVVQTNTIGTGGFEGVSESSSRRYGVGAPSSTPLFSFKTDGSNSNYFLRRQSYDYFNGEVWDNEGPDPNRNNSDDYGRTITSNNPEYLNDDILADMAELGFIPYDRLNSMLFTAHGRVYDDSFAPMYLPAPYATIMDENDYSSSEYIKYPHGEIYRKSFNGGRDPQELDDSFIYLEPTGDFYEVSAELGLDGDDYIYELTLRSEDSDAAERLLEDYQRARYKYGANASYADDEVTQFAYSIVEGCNSDIEKAVALEQYFENNGFVYDTDYVPEDESIEYFLFEGKTGVCSSYATAMTILARSIGLPARYVEGFAAFERQEDGSFLIREGYAHAWVEVYIPGAGWMTFDPTVSGYMQVPEDNFDTNTFFMVLGRFLIVIAVVFVIVFVMLLDRILELILRLRLRFKAPAERTLMLYANVIKLINFSTREDYSSYTVKMVRSYLSETRAAVPELLLQLFEKVCFGGYTPTEEEYSAAYSEYKKCYKYLRKVPKPAQLEKLKGVPAMT